MRYTKITCVFIQLNYSKTKINNKSKTEFCPDFCMEYYAFSSREPNRVACT